MSTQVEMALLILKGAGQGHTTNSDRHGYGHTTKAAKMCIACNVPSSDELHSCDVLQSRYVIRPRPP